MRENESNDKVVTKDEIKTVIEREKESQRRIVFTNGCFDLIHPVHIDFLQQAKRRGDILVVAINSDESVKHIKGEHRPILGETERAFVLSALDFVDYIVIFEEDTPEALLEDLRPDVLVKGSDYELNEVVGKDIVESHGGEVQIISTGKRFSTTDLIQRIVNTCKDKKDIDFLRMFAIETQRQMGSLVATEYQWLRSYMLVLAILLTFLGTVGNLLKGYKYGSVFFFVCSVMLASFLMILTSLICLKITKENLKYRNYGTQLERMWRYFHLYESGVYLKEPILPEDARRIGKGLGFSHSIGMLLLLTAMSSLTIVTIGIFYFCSDFPEALKKAILYVFR